MFVLNFSHPLTENHINQVADLAMANITDVQVIDIKVQVDLTQPLVSQVKDLVDSVDLTSTQWQASQIVANLAGLSAVSAIILAELHGRMGYFPTIMRLAQNTQVPPAYEVKELIGLQHIRNTARTLR